MGSSSWSNAAYSTLRASHAKATTEEIFTSSKAHRPPEEMVPKADMIRESRDSAAHPGTFGVCVFLDVTGSMHKIPDVLVRHKLGALMSTLVSRGLPDAQVLFGAIGDHYNDRWPLQVGQFESGTDELNKWLTSVFLEGGGGGTMEESYLLAWLFAARHTSCDGFEKRGRKGFLFTIGDEGVWTRIDGEHLKKIMGYAQPVETTAKQLLSEAQRMYHVFHIHVSEGSNGKNARTVTQWKDLLGQNLILCEDYREIAEIIAATVAVVNGVNLDTVTSSFEADTADRVTAALSVLTGRFPMVAGDEAGGIEEI